MKGHGGWVVVVVVGGGVVKKMELPEALISSAA